MALHGTHLVVERHEFIITMELTEEWDHYWGPYTALGDPIVAPGGHPVARVAVNEQYIAASTAYSEVTMQGPTAEVWRWDNRQHVRSIPDCYLIGTLILTQDNLISRASEEPGWGLQLIDIETGAVAREILTPHAQNAFYVAGGDLLVNIQNGTDEEQSQAITGDFEVCCVCTCARIRQCV